MFFVALLQVIGAGDRNHERFPLGINQGLPYVCKIISLVWKCEETLNVDSHGENCLMDILIITAIWGAARIPTLPETNIAPKNGWLEYYFPIGKAYFQGLC